MKFNDYSISSIIKRNLESLGFRKPTDIQFKSIPCIMRGEDVLAIAQTGTGKTAAFAIPVLNALHQRKLGSRSEGIKCIVMVPTHELARQITDVFHKIGSGTRVNTFCVHGGVEQDPQIAELRKGVDVMVATPGRLFDLASQGHIQLHRVEVLILDEADHMLDLGFIKDIRDLCRKLPRKRQTLFFSATINEKIKDMAHEVVVNPIRIQVSPKNPVNKNIHHSVAFVEMDDKRFFLERLVNENPDSKMLVFVRTKVRAERVSKAMARVGIKTETIHSDKEHKDRERVMNDFRSGEVKVLIATDVSARGIDIPGVDYVANYDLPDIPENYVHRVGRTGRGTQKGRAVSFCSSEEKPLLEQIEKYIGTVVEVLGISNLSYRETIDLTSDTGDNNWRKLIEEAEAKKATGKKRRK